MYRPRFPYVRSALHTVDRPMSRSNSLPQTRATREKPGENFDPAPRLPPPLAHVSIHLPYELHAPRLASPRLSYLAHLVSIISPLSPVLQLLAGPNYLGR